MKNLLPYFPFAFSFCLLALLPSCLIMSWCVSSCRSSSSVLSLPHRLPGHKGGRILLLSSPVSRGLPSDGRAGSSRARKFLPARPRRRGPRPRFLHRPPLPFLLHPLHSPRRSRQAKPGLLFPLLRLPRTTLSPIPPSVRSFSSWGRSVPFSPLRRYFWMTRLWT